MRDVHGSRLHEAAPARTRAFALLLALAAICSTLSLALASPVLAVAPGNAPELLAPAAGAEVERNPSLRWAAVPGAARYRVQISTSEAFSTLAYNVDTSGLTATPPVELPLGVLHWRVSGLDTAGAAGPAATATFTKAFDSRPLLTSPADAPVGSGTGPLQFPADPALLVWQPLAGARSYEIEIDDDPEFVGATLQSTENTSFTLLEPQTAGRYYWHVRGRSGTINSAWSETRTYVVTWPEVPTLLSPSNTAAVTVEDVVLRWNPVRGAATYQVQIAPSAAFTDLELIDVVVKGTQFSPDNTTLANSVDNGSYFWRVRPRDARTVPATGEWSQAWTFQRAWVDQPQLRLPANGAVVVDAPTFSWSGIDHASHYDLQVGTDPEFSPGTFTRCLVNQTSFTPYALRSPALGGNAPVVASRTSSDACAGIDPVAGQTYHWRVRGVDDPALPTIVGVVSEARSFLYRPASPRIVSPRSTTATPTVMTAPVLDWDAVLGAGQYLVTVLRANNTTAFAPVTTQATSFTPVVKLVPADGPFRWYVQTKDFNGRLGLVPAQNQWGSFTLAAPTTFEPTPDPLEGVDAPPSATMPAMTWTPVEGAAKYAVRYGVAGSNVVVGTPLGANLPYTGFTSTTTLTPGSWFWYVEAFGEDGRKIGESSYDGTFTIETLARVSPLSPANCEPGQPCASLKETPRLDWSPVPAAGAYLVYLARDPNFTNLVRVYRTVHPTLTPRESLPDSEAGEAYYWFVRPCRATEMQCGAFETALDGAFAFRKGSNPISLTSPANDDVVAGTPRFAWQDYYDTAQATPPAVDQGATRYRIQVSTVADFSTVLETVLVDQAQYAPKTTTYPEGPLFWRVQAVDASGNSLTFSEVRRLTKRSGSPTVLSPLPEADVPGVPFFRWAPHPGAARYEVEIARNGDVAFSPGNRVLTINTVKQAAWSPVNSLEGRGTYAWRLRAIDVDGRAGSWTNGATFTLTASEPLLRAPVLEAVSRADSVVFDWDPVPGAAQYRLQTSTLASFASTVESQATVMDIWAPTRAYAEGTYFWRVQTLDADGNVVSTSPGDAVEQRRRSVTVCGGGPADRDADGFRDGCDDVDDVDNRAMGYESVKALLNLGITGGCSVNGDMLLYCPANRVIRGDMALFLARFKLGRAGADALPDYVPGTFNDVSATDYYAKAVRYLRDEQITLGCGGGGYCPAAQVKRGDMALFIARTTLGTARTNALPEYQEGTFEDVVASDYYSSAVRYLRDSRITLGCAEGLYCPASDVTREQMAIFLVRALRLS